MRDHPRLCGEKVFGGKDEASYKGSPPPMRGKDFLYLGEKMVHRITPAYAGKSCIDLCSGDLV